jgi:aspartate-semialdehyde dehydrogenase
MAGKIVRVGVVGAASLAGKELAEVLADSSFAEANIVLLDDEVAAGQVTAAGDEVAVIQRLSADSFDGMDFVFFTGHPEMTRRYWKAARQASASIVDMTYALTGEPNVMVRAPWTLSGAVSLGPDLSTPAVVAAHPAAVILALIATRLLPLGLHALAATVFEPASEHGHAAMDELHRQTVSLLSFQPLPREQFDAQVAFNLLPALGDAARIKLETVKRRIVDHYALLGAGRLPVLALELVQAPVFHGYVASVLIDLNRTVMPEQVEVALQGEHLDLVGQESDAPSNLSAAGQADILVRVAEGQGSHGHRFWVWFAADNLRFAAANAVECAQELRKLRPLGTVQ